MLSQCVQSFPSHCWRAFSCVFDACVCREVGLKPCASCIPHTNAVWGLFTNRIKKIITDNQMYKMCLVSKQTCRIIIILNTWHNPPSVTGHSSCISSGSVRSTRKKYENRLISHISSRGTGSTFDISQHRWRISPRRSFLLSETTVCNQCAL